MHDPHRPTFEREVPGTPPGPLAERVAAALARNPHGMPHRRAGGHFQIWIPDGRRHMWSPWLHLDVLDSPSGAGASQVFGRFTPAPSLWTGVMLAYLALGTLAVGGGLFGWVQWTVGEAPWGLWFVPGALVGALAILLSSRAGQALAREQMGELVAAIEPALNEAPRR